MIDGLKYCEEITIIDFEASGLMKGGFPIEIAWQNSGEASAMSSFLIKPTVDWLSNEYLWSFESEKIHGISKIELLKIR